MHGAALGSVGNIISSSPSAGAKSAAETYPGKIKNPSGRQASEMPILSVEIRARQELPRAGPQPSAKSTLTNQAAVTGETSLEDSSQKIRLTFGLNLQVACSDGPARSCR